MCAVQWCVFICDNATDSRSFPAVLRKQIQQQPDVHLVRQEAQLCEEEGLPLKGIVQCVPYWMSCMTAGIRHRFSRARLTTYSILQVCNNGCKGSKGNKLAVDRDTSAGVCFWIILASLAEGKGVPKAFQRPRSRGVTPPRSSLVPTGEE